MYCQESYPVSGKVFVLVYFLYLYFNFISGANSFFVKKICHFAYGNKQEKNRTDFFSFFQKMAGKRRGILIISVCTTVSEHSNLLQQFNAHEFY